MRASLTIFALIVSSGVGAFAGAIEHDHLVKRGGAQICTFNLDGSGETDVQVTKDCCAFFDQETYFNEEEKQCQPYSSFSQPGVGHTGTYVDCCSSRGRGSRAV
ncbi:hypothetical protein AGABI1DRAFT_132565 [Agaricus bisporus var. burnettii JB137-S8]|uniref:Uncharacterized protein n=1 Tax=Agaricus bisporus var. burnettii (strain JB137-S8 / ATCC MYA-4627 / FGSC 10392) TaxID=597362 RepID=K5WIN7_AGABU|nr:uncharacterized protein AGABI1DRAFT_132565 [Agaricus bisporus var. burnettii JB137-S8]EKM75116.1 hypothetical protein AGABI1DRAFT_132565 [Agaricus bisporus var. burnettii JB137-S8]